MWIWSGSVALRVLTSAGSVSGRVLLPSWKLLKFTVTGAPTGVPVNELWAAAEHAASAACWQPDMCLSGGALSGNVTGHAQAVTAGQQWKHTSQIKSVPEHLIPLQIAQRRFSTSAGL